MLRPTSPLAGEVADLSAGEGFLKNSENTFVAAKKVHLIRDIGFAERERDLLIACFSSFFPHFLGVSYAHTRRHILNCQI